MFYCHFKLTAHPNHIFTVALSDTLYKNNIWILLCENILVFLNSKLSPFFYVFSGFRLHLSQSICYEQQQNIVKTLTICRGLP